MPPAPGRHPSWNAIVPAEERLDAVLASVQTKRSKNQTLSRNLFLLQAVSAGLTVVFLALSSKDGWAIAALISTSVAGLASASNNYFRPGDRWRHFVAQVESIYELKGMINNQVAISETYNDGELPQDIAEEIIEAVSVQKDLNIRSWKSIGAGEDPDKIIKTSTGQG